MALVESSFSPSVHEISLERAAETAKEQIYTAIDQLDFGKNGLKPGWDNLMGRLDGARGLIENCEGNFPDLDFACRLGSFFLDLKPFKVKQPSIFEK